MDNAYKDIWHDWQPVLDSLWAMAKALKVPMKSKSNPRTS